MRSCRGNRSVFLLGWIVCSTSFAVARAEAGAPADCRPVDDAEETSAAAHTFYISRNNSRIAATVGDDVALQCQIRHPQKNKVAWIFEKTRRLLTLGDKSYTQDPRVSATFDPATDTWTLYLRNASVAESGVYQCQLSSHPWDRLHVYLKVTDPSNPSGLKKEILSIKDYNEPGYTLLNEDICPNEGSGVKAVILVQSAVANSHVRTVIRHTWARPAIMRDDIVFAFVLARTNDIAMLKNVQYENSLYGDIVQANFIDHYNNLTLKTLASFDWFNRYCSKASYLLKVDDDVFLNVANLITFIDQHRDDKRVIFGNVVYNPLPDRDTGSRYYVSPKIWDKTKYPRYTAGPLYLVSGDSVPAVYHRLQQRPYFFIEDVTVTGIGAQLAAVARKRAAEFFTYNVPSSDTCLFRLLIGAHQILTKEMSDIWSNVNDKKTVCPHSYSPDIWKPCVQLKAQASLKHCVLTLFSSTKS